MRSAGPSPAGGRAAAFALLALGALASPAGADTLFRGHDVHRGLKQSVDVVDAHLRFLQAQGARDEAMSYINWTSRWATGRMLLADGQTVAGNLSRTQFNLGAGAGTMSEGAFFAGANIDLTGVTNPLWQPIDNISTLAAGQTYLFAGVAYGGFQLTYASKQDFVDAGALGLDPWGNYRPADAFPSFRPGTPWAIGSPDDDEPWLIDVLSVYESRTGAYLSVAWADVPITRTVVDESGRMYGHYAGNETRVVDVRFHLQPLRLIPRDVTDIVGVPGVGARRLDGATALSLEDLQRVRDEVAMVNEALESADAPWEIDFGTEDVLGGGLRWRVVQRVTPDPMLRRAELGYVDDHPLGPSLLRVGAQAVLHRRAADYEFAAEAFALVKPLREATGFGNVSLGFAYSYNSPDTATFLPIPDAHVFGLQVLVGPAEAARPLVPLVRAVEDRRGAFGEEP